RQVIPESTVKAKRSPPASRFGYTPRPLQGLGLLVRAHAREGFLRLRRALSSSVALTPRAKVPLLAPEEQSKSGWTLSVPDLNLLEHYATDRSVGLATPAPFPTTGQVATLGWLWVTARTKASGRCREV